MSSKTRRREALLFANYMLKEHLDDAAILIAKNYIALASALGTANYNRLKMQQIPQALATYITTGRIHENQRCLEP